MHILTISCHPEWDKDWDDEDDYDFSIECDGVGCDLWSTCDEGVHLIKWEDQYDYSSNYPATEHGLPHAYLNELGWCVPWPGCAYDQAMEYSDSHWDIAREHGVGRYEVEIDWVETTSADILYVSTLDTEPVEVIG